MIWLELIECDHTHPAGTSENSDKCNTIKNFLLGFIRVSFDKIYFEVLVKIGNVCQ